MPNLYGVNGLTDEDFETIFSQVAEPAPAPQESQDQSSQEQTQVVEQTPENKEPDVTTTQAFSKRLNESLAADHERIAKALGYSSYDEMMKQANKKIYDDSGLDPEVVSPVVEKVLNNDPGYQAYRQQQATDFAKGQLQALQDATGLKFQSLNEVPKDVLEDWRSSHDLKGSYMKLHGEDLVKQLRTTSAAGTTDHLKPLGGSPIQSGKTVRHLTEQEKRAYKAFYPNVSDTDLEKMTKEE